MQAKEPDSGVDVNVLAEYLGDDPQVMAQVLAEFRVQLQAIGTALYAYHAAGDRASVAREAHSLKSSARTVGAMRLGDICDRLERVAWAGDTGELERCVQAFQQEAQQVADAMAR